METDSDPELGIQVHDLIPLRLELMSAYSRVLLTRKPSARRLAVCLTPFGVCNRYV